MAVNQQKESPGVTGWLFQSLVTPALVSLVSTALIAGCGFLFFGAREELHQLDQVRLQMAQQTESVRLAMQMGRTSMDGWYASNKNNLASLAVLHQRLLASRTLAMLDGDFAAGAIAWCSTAIAQLTQERGAIAGYVFDDPLIKQQQANLVAERDAMIKSLDALRDMISKWNRETQDQRDEHFRT